MINYQIAAKNLHAHLFEVELTLDNPNPLGQVFSLPNWIPGSYLIRDFAKHIVGIKAYSCGQEIPINKLDKNHWITQPCEQSVKLIYQIYAFDLSVRSAYLTSERAFFNGTSVFLLPLGFESVPCQLHIVMPNSNQTLGNWSYATTLTDLGNQHFTADNYQTLIDHPVEMADFTAFEFLVADVNHKMTITGQHEADIARLKTDIATICQHHINFFNSDIPFNDYLFLTLVRKNAYGGLEHKQSSSLICNRQDMPKVGSKTVDQSYAKFLALCSHEYFHAWWIKTIKPASFHQLNLNQENYTEQLWVFEGFTSYYDELSLLRSQILTPEQYLTLLAKTITRVQRSQGRFNQPLADASYDAWTRFYQQDENAPNATVSYYTKGALLAFVLDIQIRQCTNDEHSLDDVLKTIWMNYQTTGIENNTVQQIVAQITQSDFSDFFTNYLYDTQELPLQKAFDYIGIALEFTHKDNDLSDFGIAFNQDLTITTVFANSCAQIAGLYVGDKIISVNHIQVQQKNFVKTIAATVEGKVLQVGLFRDGLLMQIPVIYQLLEPTYCTLSIVKNIDSKTLNRQKQWLNQE